MKQLFHWHRIGSLPLFVSVPLLSATSVQGQEAAAATYQEDMAWLERADASRTYVQDSAAVRIDEFIDFACSTCQAFFILRADSLKERLVDPGSVNLVVRPFPLARLMRGFQAAEAALCAGALGDRRGFEGMQHRLFMNQATWQPLRNPIPLFEQYAQEIHLPPEEFRDCLARDAMAPLIIHDLRLGNGAQVAGTPSFVFNRGTEIHGDIQFYGNQPLEAFEDAIRRVPGGL